MGDGILPRTDQPLVSIIMIFFNAERFIQEALESVFTQTYDNWELLLVNDGSTDGSSDIAQQYTGRAPEQVHYLEHPGHQNRGMSASRNLGIRNAKGEYIAFLDADDVWLPHKLMEQVAIFNSQPQAAMVYGLSQFWYSWTGNPEDSNSDFIHSLGVSSGTPIHPPGLIIHFFLAQDAAIPGTIDILVRREAIERVGGFEEVFRGAYEDEAFYAKICLHESVIPVNTCWARYRQHPDSSTSIIERRKQEYSARRYFLNWLSRYLREQGFVNTGIQESLREEIRRCHYPIFYELWRDKKDLLLRLGRRILPLCLRRWLWAKWKGIDYCPPPGWVRFGNLRRLTPLSKEFGYDRGKPIDRYYIEKFLTDHQQDIHGHVLEVQDDHYTSKFGGKRVVKSDVLHVEPGHPEATIVADLTNAAHISSDSFDCIILTQTLQLIYDLRVAIKTIYRILKPGGVLLATFPGISPISRYDMEKWGDYWRFTSLSARRLFEEIFPADCVKIRAYGNVLTATAFLYGLATNDLKQQELEHFDPDYEIIIAVRATKGENGNNKNTGRTAT